MGRKTPILFTVFVLAGLVSGFTGTARGGVSINFLAGSNTWDESFFEKPRGGVLGCMTTIGSAQSPVSMAIDYMYSVQGSHKKKHEWDVGLRKVFRGRRFDGYVGGGVAVVSAEWELHWEHSCGGWLPVYGTYDCQYEEHTISIGITPGGWTGIGGYVKAWRFGFGFDIRYAVVPAKFDGYSGPGNYVVEAQDVKLGGSTVTLVIGINL